MAANPARTLAIWFTALFGVGLPLALPWLHPGEYCKPTAWSGVLLVSGMILAGKLAKSLLVGLLAALFVALHPSSFVVGNFDSAWALANSLFWWVLVMLLAAWRLAAAQRVYWKPGLCLFLGLALVNWWVWASDRLWGVVCGSVITMTLTVAAVFGRGRGPARAVAANRVGAFVAGIAVTILAAAALQSWHRQPLSDLLPSLPPWQQPAAARLWTEQAAEAFFGAWWWLVLFFVLWGWYRTVRRGVRDLARNRAPAVWTVSLAAAATALAATLKPDEGFTHLVPWCAFLLVYWIADGLHGLGERLVLPPLEPKDI